MSGSISLNGAAAAQLYRNQGIEERPAAAAAGGGLRASIGGALTRIGQAIGDKVAQITHSGRYGSEAVFAASNPYVQALSVPAPGQNGIHDGGILARHGDAITAKLDAYREACGSKVSAEQMRALINTGEHLVNALNRGQAEGGTITLTVDGQTHEVKSSLHTTRAISWYLTAKAAEQEVLMGGDHLVREGSMVMADPGNKLFDFINAAPTSYGRVSTHFNERHDGAGADRHNVGFSGLFTSKPAQRGIEDFQGMLPSKKGALSFDRLKGADGSPQLFMKFESVGMPTVFRLSGHGEAHESGLRKATNVFRSIGNCVRHACNFITSRFDRAHGPQYVHKEHVSKGEPKERVWQPFNELVGLLDTGTRAARREADALLSDAKKHGISFIEDALKEMPGGFGLTPKPGREEEFATALRELSASVARYHAELGPDMGVERKGKETHVSLETYPDLMFRPVGDDGGRVQMDRMFAVPLD